MSKSFYVGLLVVTLGLPASSYALSPEAEAGKAFYSACDSCHNQATDPALAPPMWGVKRRYMRASANPEEFIEKMSRFVSAPSLESAIHTEGVKQLGLMPPMPLPKEVLKNITTYIFEEDFPPPCDHWRIAVRDAEERGDSERAAKEQRQLNRFCQ